MEEKFNWSELSNYNLSFMFTVCGPIGDIQEYLIFSKDMPVEIYDYILVFNNRNSFCKKTTKKYKLTTEDKDILYSIYQWKKYKEFKKLSFKIEGQYLPNIQDINLCFTE